MPIHVDRRSFMIAGSALAAGGVISNPAAARDAGGAGIDLIILIPGIGGSVLSQNGKDAWAPSAKGMHRAIKSLGSSLASLKLVNDPVDSDDCGDGVTADRLVPDVHLIPGLWRIDGYTKISDTIVAMPGVVKDKNFFTLPYDWRRDNRVSARRLAKKSELWLQAWRESSGNRDAKLILVCHSMGGLVARYFLECMTGWKVTRKLITYGTPYRGSPIALDFIHNGMKVGPIKLDGISALFRTFTSVYQLLPIYPCIESGGVISRVSELNGIENVDQQRAIHALKFHQEIEAAVKRNQRVTQYRQKGYQIHPIVGISQDTLQSARRSEHKLIMSRAVPNLVFSGDGTVPRASATPIEIQEKNLELFVSENHGSLQNSDLTLGQLKGLLTAGAMDWTAYRGVDGALALNVPSAMRLGETFQFKGALDAAIFRRAITITFSDAYSGSILKTVSLTATPDGKYAGKTAGLNEGTYRIKAEFTKLTTPDNATISDVFIVVAA
ncbi:lipase/acyltransferase domain-containing protein [Duganella sp. CT11-25]|uniref:lipase/acyltransferase domain-containing protein n=1 Tax=unclassified Duganella TaxID=2636909 RepID=UPI0039AEB24A